MKAITLISIAKSVAMEIDVVGVTVDRSRTNGPSWIASVEATYDGAQHVLRAEGASAEDAQRRALALGVKAALPKPIFAELLALNEDTDS
jgi:hypothetical protein